MSAAEAVAPTVALRRLVDGFQVSQALYVVATLGIPDLLAKEELTSEQLAERVGAIAPALHRVMRALAGVGVFVEDPRRRFSLTSLGRCLCSDVADPVGGWATFIGRPYHWQAWSGLLHTVQTGQTAFEHIHGRTGWQLRRVDPAEAVIFDRAMTDLSLRASHAILEAYDFTNFATIVDVGGGKGALLAAILGSHREARGVLVDLPHVVNNAEPLLRMADVVDRCAVVAGDFFESVPRGGDAYILKSVLHDWPDDESVSILRTCRRAMRSSAKLLIVERVINAQRPDPDVLLSDLEMLVGNGGRERTLGEYDALLDAAGLRLETEHRTLAGFSVLEVVHA